MHKKLTNDSITLLRFTVKFKSKGNCILDEHTGQQSTFSSNVTVDSNYQTTRLPRHPHSKYLVHNLHD